MELRQFSAERWRPVGELSAIAERAYPACAGTPTLKKCAKFRAN